MYDVTWATQQVFGLEGQYRFTCTIVLSRIGQPAFDTKAKYVSRYLGMFGTFPDGGGWGGGRGAGEGRGGAARGLGAEGGRQGRLEK